MATGTVQFAAPLRGLQFEPIEIADSRPAVEKIVLEAQNDGWLHIVIHLIDIFNFEDAEAIANGILPSILNRIAFYRNVSVGEPHFRGGTLPKGASGSSFTVRKDLQLMWDHATPVLTLGEETRQELARILEQQYTHHDLYSAYRFALSQSDPVARFMFLYNILLQLNGDNQQQVDAFIRSEIPGVPQSPRPDRRGIIETVYTRLRNEVGHRRPGATPEMTRKEIQENVAPFQVLVRTAISRVV